MSKINFKLQPGGHYTDDEGREMTIEEIQSLTGYIVIELINDRSQVNHESIPAGFILVPENSLVEFNETIKGLSKEELKSLHSSLITKEKKTSKN